jgi:hypothetical protein
MAENELLIGAAMVAIPIAAIVFLNLSNISVLSGLGIVVGAAAATMAALGVMIVKDALV